MGKETVVKQNVGSLVSKKMKWYLVFLAVGSAMTKMDGDWKRVIGVGVVVGAFINIVNHMSGDE